MNGAEAAVFQKKKKLIIKKIHLVVGKRLRKGVIFSPCDDFLTLRSRFCFWVDSDPLC